MNAETGLVSDGSQIATWLQWGRVLMNAETPSGLKSAARQALCFNGAAFS